MKLTEKYIVFRNQESGNYLTDYHNEGTLAYKAEYIDAIKHAKTMSFEAFEEQRETVELMAKVFDCEILVVEATYDLKQLNGEDVQEIEMTEEEQAKAALRSLLDMLGE